MNTVYIQVTQRNAYEVFLVYLSTLYAKEFLFDDLKVLDLRLVCMYF